MKPKNCLIFGGSGQIGSFLIRKLTKNNIKVTVVTRNTHQKGLKIKTQGNAGYIDVKESNIFDEKKIEKLFSEADYCINLIGILYEKKRGNTFKNIHTIFPTILVPSKFEFGINSSSLFCTSSLLGFPILSVIKTRSSSFKEYG